MLELSGGSSYKHGDGILTTQHSNGWLGEEYEEGTRQPLRDFAIEMQLKGKVDLNSCKDLIAYVTDHYPHVRCMLDRVLGWVVDIPDHSTAFGKRRYRRSNQLVIKQCEVERHDTREQADEHMESIKSAINQDTYQETISAVTMEHPNESHTLRQRGARKQDP